MNKSFWTLVGMSLVLMLVSAVMESPVLMLVPFMIISYLILNMATRKKEEEEQE